MTSFERVLQICGLDEQAAIPFFDQPAEVVRGWIDGSREVPAAAWAMLAQLYGQLERAAERSEIVLNEAGLDPTLWNEGMGIPDPAERLPNGAEINAGLIASLRRLHKGLAADGTISA
ncbi:hypothetical protein [Palleronia sp.]|uniref:hypothetical protein n=1 Tax=Palleronia sp. TaxID=1940284 RepID=UPI0035C84546